VPISDCVMRRHDQKAKYFRFADRVSASTTRGVRSLAERRNDPGGFHRPKKTTKLFFDVAQIPSTRAPYIFFLPTKDCFYDQREQVEKQTLLRSRDESERSARV